MVFNPEAYLEEAPAASLDQFIGDPVWLEINLLSLNGRFLSG